MLSCLIYLIGEADAANKGATSVSHKLVMLALVGLCYLTITFFTLPSAYFTMLRPFTGALSMVPLVL